MEQEKVDKIQVIVLCLVIAFFLMMSMKVNAQERLHEVDTVKYKYFDLQSRPVRPGFFQETNMGFSCWFLADDGVIRKKVYVYTIKE